MPGTDTFSETQTYEELVAIHDAMQAYFDAQVLGAEHEEMLEKQRELGALIVTLSKQKISDVSQALEAQQTTLDALTADAKKARDAIEAKNAYIKHMANAISTLDRVIKEVAKLV